MIARPSQCEDDEQGPVAGAMPDSDEALFGGGRIDRGRDPRRCGEGGFDFGDRYTVFLTFVVIACVPVEPCHHRLTMPWSIEICIYE
jgi:hypothetical protein